MSRESSRLRTLFSRFGTLLESIFTFILLLSGVGVVFIGKVTSVIGVGWGLLSVGVAVQIVALILLGVYFYIRFLRRRIATE